jgi:hypothetical protein
MSKEAAGHKAKLQAIVHIPVGLPPLFRPSDPCLDVINYKKYTPNLHEKHTRGHKVSDDFKEVVERLRREDSESDFVEDKDIGSNGLLKDSAMRVARSASPLGGRRP